MDHDTKHLQRSRNSSTFSISHPRYIAWNGDYEVVNRGDLDETPVQKYQRLNCEVRELIEELEEAKKAAKEDAGADGKESLVNVANKVIGLQEELTSLNLEERLGSDMLKSLQDPRGAANARLLAHLEKLKGSGTSGSGKAAAGDAAKDDESAVTYELLMKPNTAKMEQMERIAQFDKRLEFLEKTLGVAPESLVRNCSQFVICAARKAESFFPFLSDFWF